MYFQLYCVKSSPPESDLLELSKKIYLPSRNPRDVNYRQRIHLQESQQTVDYVVQKKRSTSLPRPITYIYTDGIGYALTPSHLVYAKRLSTLTACSTTVDELIDYPEDSLHLPDV